MKMVIIVMVFIFPVLCDVESGLSVLENKIVGGDKVQHGSIKFVASLREADGTHFCGGALINKNHILTAAHCIHPYVTIPKFERIFVVFGTISIYRSGQLRIIRHLDVHKGYVPGQNGAVNDIGLVTFRKPAGLNNKVSLLKLPEYDVAVDTEAVVFGWGSRHPFTKYDTPKRSEFLIKLTVKIINESKCEEYYPERTIANSQFCAIGKEDYDNISKGDSGGPMVHKNEIIGIVSFGYTHTAMIPTIYTNICKHLEYIEAAKQRASRSLVLQSSYYEQ